MFHTADSDSIVALWAARQPSHGEDTVVFGNITGRRQRPRPGTDFDVADVFYAIHVLLPYSMPRPSHAYRGAVGRTRK